jgi:hypothetical protein
MTKSEKSATSLWRDAVLQFGVFTEPGKLFCGILRPRIRLTSFSKSHLAWQAARLVHQEDKVDHAFWVDISRLEKGFRRIADMVFSPPRTLTSVEVLEHVHQWLTRCENGNWVLVIDEADHNFEKSDPCDPTAPAPSEYIPRGLPHGYKILTTSSKDVALRFLRDEGDYVFEVPNLEPAEARDLFKQFLGEKLRTKLWKNKPDSETDAWKLVNKLDCHPGMYSVCNLALLGAKWSKVHSDLQLRT